MRNIFQRFFILLMILLTFLSNTELVFAQGPTDVIRNYGISVIPQSDGSLLNVYTLEWCVISDTAGPLTDINLGMPNNEYEIVDFGGDVVNANVANTGAYSLVNLRLDKAINSGECVNVSVTIHQYEMAYLDSSTGEVEFQFTPGWFDEIEVEHLQIIWMLPIEHSYLKSFEPEPTLEDEAQLIWETRLEAGDKFTINLLYAQEAFPDYGKESTPLWGSSQEGKNNTEDIEPTNGSLGLPFVISPCICTAIILILVVIIVLWILFSVLRGYTRGGYIGSPSTGRTTSRPGGWVILPPIGGSGSRTTTKTPSIPRRSGGGSGLFGGRGSSCACVSCACACACAGGGRAGCSRKGFDISGLTKSRQVQK